MSFLQDNGGPIAIGAVVLALIGGYIELRLPSEADLQARVDAKFVAAGAVPVHRVAAIEEDIVDLEAADLSMYDKMYRMALILQEE